MRKHTRIILTMYLLGLFIFLVHNIVNQNRELRILSKEVQELEILLEEKLEERRLLEEEFERLEEEKRLLEEMKVFSMEATAYTDDVASQGKWVGQTATGRKPQVGVVAVDPKIIPLETKLYIEGYGEAIAGDVGGAIKGNRIDVFLPDSKSCYEWGRRQVRVRVIE